MHCWLLFIILWSSDAREIPKIEHIYFDNKMACQMAEQTIAAEAAKRRQMKQIFIQCLKAG